MTSTQPASSNPPVSGSWWQESIGRLSSEARTGAWVGGGTDGGPQSPGPSRGSPEGNNDKYLSSQTSV